jgi:drug/metabolite transporter (DMT)-like permease
MSDERPETPAASNPEPSRGAIAAALAVGSGAVTFAGVLIRWLGLTGVPLLAGAFYRLAFATAALGAIAATRGTTWPARADRRIIVFSGVCLALHFGLWTLSFDYIPVGRSVLIVSSQTIFVVAAAALVLGERPPARAVVGSLLALAGIGVVSFGGLSEASASVWRGDALALGGAIAVVGYILAGRVARARTGLLGYVVPVYGVACAILFLWCLASGTPLGGFGARAWIGFALLAAIPTIFGHTVFNWLIGHVRADTVSVALLAEPVGAAALAYLLFGEVPSTATLLGAPLILGGLALASLTPGAASPRRGRARGAWERTGSR